MKTKSKKMTTNKTSEELEKEFEGKFYQIFQEKGYSAPLLDYWYKYITDEVLDWINANYVSKVEVEGIIKKCVDTTAEKAWDILAEDAEETFDDVAKQLKSNLLGKGDED